MEKQTETKETTKKSTASVAAKPTKKVAAKPTTPKPPVAKATAPVVEKIAESKQEAPKAEAPKAKKTKSTMAKVIEAGNSTRKIVTKAGGKIIGNSIETTKTIAGLYSKAGKKALEIGKDLISDTTKAVAKNQKNLRQTSVEAFKETVETIKETNLIDNPLKGILKSKKK
jgi:hypothetical protein